MSARFVALHTGGLGLPHYQLISSSGLPVDLRKTGAKDLGRKETDTEVGKGLEGFV